MPPLGRCRPGRRLRGGGTAVEVVQKLNQHGHGVGRPERNGERPAHRRIGVAQQARRFFVWEDDAKPGCRSNPIAWVGPCTTPRQEYARQPLRPGPSHFFSASRDASCSGAGRSKPNPFRRHHRRSRAGTAATRRRRAASEAKAGARLKLASGMAAMRRVILESNRIGRERTQEFQGEKLPARRRHPKTDQVDVPAWRQDAGRRASVNV